MQAVICVQSLQSIVNSLLSGSVNRLAVVASGEGNMTDCHHLRERLVELAGNIQDSRDRGWNDLESLAEFERLLPDTDIDSMCDSDLDIETIVDICLGKEDTQRHLSRAELLELVRKFTSPGADYYSTEAESILAVQAFNDNCRHPAGSDLIFYPEDHFNGRTDPTPEEIVDKALSGQ